MSVLAAAVASIASDVRPAEACSCVEPSPRFLSPHAAKAPLNTHARVEVPTEYAARTFVLRAHHGSAVPTRTERVAGPELTVIDLAPLSALAPETRYEIDATDATAHPPTLVLGTFVTGSTTDTSAPTMPSLGAVRTNLNLGHVNGGMCSVRGPWLTFAKSVAADPGRADAELGFLVWKVAPGSAFDPRKPADALLFPFRDVVTVGAAGLCEYHHVELKGGAIDLVVAAVDEAGNRSPSRRAHVDLTKPSP